MGNSLIERIMADKGIMKVPLCARSSVGYRAIVQATSEYWRIYNIPEREWTMDSVLEMAKILTEDLRTPTGSMELWPIQALALAECALESGLLGPIAVGKGKALISLLAPVVMEAKRPILFVPAELRDQTQKYVIPQMEKHWRLHADLRICGYSELSLAKNSKLLETLHPDLIILDEAHYVSRPKAGRTKRLMRYFRDNPQTQCVALSGTLTKRSLADYEHISYWCLKERSPLPHNWNELQLWAGALDEKVPDEKRVGPGKLLDFYKEFYCQW